MRFGWLLVLLALAQPLVAAESLDAFGNLTQSEFRELTEDVGAMVAYPAPVPHAADDLRVGFSLDWLRPAHETVLDKAAGGRTFGDAVLGRAHLGKRLPYGLTFNGSYGSVAGSNIDVLGFALDYRLPALRIPLPETFVRVNYTTVSGVSELDMHTRGFDLVVAKRLDGFTPYAGIGRVWVDNRTRQVALEHEVLTLQRYQAGLRLDWAPYSVAVHAARSGQASEFGLRVSLGL